MAVINDNIKENINILLARNTPVALVVGAAGFLGSHLVDKLLEKNIQVIGADDLTYGQRKNLSKASENRDFHLIIESSSKLDLDLARLDYIFIIPHKQINLDKILDLFRKSKSRLLLVSSIDLYNKKDADNYQWLEGIELNIAKQAQKHNLNARILRIGSVFGPRMTFERQLEKPDPLIRLIQQSLLGDLQKEISLDFSSRALFVSDACDLLVKCIFAGATAQKIFDGVSNSPIKVSEIKQVLLDPIWYESRDFTPTILPPWPTPNLDKTIKFLNWQPGAKLVASLRETLSYFKDNEIEVPELEDGRWRVPARDASQREAGGEGGKEDGDWKVEDRKEDEEWKVEKAEELKGLKSGGPARNASRSEAGGEEKKVKKGSRQSKWISFNAAFFWIGILLIIYALVWPAAQLSFGVLTFKTRLIQAVLSLEKGDLEKSLSEVRQANAGALQAKSIINSLDAVKKTGLLKKQIELGDQLTELAIMSTETAQDTILGVSALITSLKSITGELSGSPKDYIDQSLAFLTSANGQLSKINLTMDNPDFKSSLPKILAADINNLSSRLTVYADVVKKGRAIANVLPEIVAMDGHKNYLVLLQNNGELRPTGGFIGALAKISFENGKLKKLEIQDTYAIDGQLKIHVEPPKEIKSDLGQVNYYLRDSNFEPDFPTAARQAEWFYTKETGERVEGVLALDISAIENLLSSLGSLDLPDYNTKIDQGNLFEKAVNVPEANFLTALTTALFNKLFFLPNQNWPATLTSLGKSLEEKHMSVYLDNPRLFSYVVSQNWAGLMPRGKRESNTTVDFLAPVEANLGTNKANYYLDRNYHLETMIGQDGEVTHKLRIAYTNRSPSNAFPAGKYKNRFRIYLPFPAKLTKVLWGETDITKKAESFVDYGRSGYSILVELLPKEQKTLVLEYQTPLKLEYKEGKALYKLNVVKQAGTLKDPFEWRVTYPINVKLSSNQNQKIGPQEYLVQTDLSTDKTFQLEFTRS